MALTVDFVTMGDASKILGVNSSTLRLWTEELEKNDVHYVIRNQRDERLYYESDLEIFAFVRDQKKEHGRKAQTKDIALMIYQKAVQEDMFDLRLKEDAPRPEPTMTTLELLNNDDVQKLLDSDRVKQLMGYMISEATSKIKDDLIEEVRETVRSEMVEYDSGAIKVLQEIDNRRKKREEEADKKEEARWKEIEDRERMREERDKKEREEWQEKQEAMIKQLQEANMRQLQEALTKEPEPEQPKKWYQKLFGQ
ncbi:MerR family transcriptional regulator [Peribacillus asahii]|uniref:MerR family transcriptional regulator n=1 Tax=Peribacillus asahii TaxID=228899 RepID=UPI0037F609EB